MKPRNKQKFRNIGSIIKIYMITVIMLFFLDFRDRTTQAQEERKKAQIELSTLENDKRKLVSEAAAMEREIERIIENSADRYSFNK